MEVIFVKWFDFYYGSQAFWLLNNFFTQKSTETKTSTIISKCFPSVLRLELNWIKKNYKWLSKHCNELNNETYLQYFPSPLYEEILQPLQKPVNYPLVFVLLQCKCTLATVIMSYGIHSVNNKYNIVFLDTDNAVFLIGILSSHNNLLTLRNNTGCWHGADEMSSLRNGLAKAIKTWWTLT